VSAIPSKSSLRQQLREQLKKLTAASRHQASIQMAAFLPEFAAWNVARRIYAFSPLTNEPDLTRWDWSGKSLALPRMTATGLEFHQVSGFSALPIHSLGMAEPPADAPAALPPDLVLVPGLGFDRQGHRLGRGAGYYDRFLATLPSATWRIGVGFECQVRDSIPTEPHDIRLHGLVTELGVTIFSAPQNSL